MSHDILSQPICIIPSPLDDSVNLDNLLIQLKQVNSMWRELGDALGLPPSILDDISGQYQSDPQQCMVEMLDSWLMRHRFTIPFWKNYTYTGQHFII